MTDLLASHRRLQLQEFRNQNGRNHVFHKVLSRSVPVTQGILVVGWHLVCHLTIFTLVSSANGPSVVEVLIESYRE